MSAEPQYSPDGRWYWNGTAWIPVAQPQQVWVKRSVPFATNAGCMIVVGIFIFLLIVGVLLGGH